MTLLEVLRFVVYQIQLMWKLVVTIGINVVCSNLQLVTK